jgi:hypothetical protein
MFEQVREIQALVRSWGDEITFDWTQAASDDEWRSVAGGDGNFASPRSEEDLSKNAIEDLAGVEAAEYVVILPGPDLVGTLVEFGIAACLHTPTFILGELERGTIFEKLPWVQHLDLEGLKRERDMLEILLEA